jgi:hypothetical protein
VQRAAFDWFGVPQFGQYFICTANGGTFEGAIVCSGETYYVWIEE